MQHIIERADPALIALARLHETRDAFEQYLRRDGPSDDADKVWHDRFESDLEAVTRTVPTTAEGFQASIAELCYQATQGFSHEAVSQWLTTFCDGVWDTVRHGRS
ncbi:hypothetical protein IED13_14325 [Bosea sp. SSUT16]|jgi:hypothetical protein|uniref:Uncharacterized protein n=1 Tax=Bosea spartocytisi TaxID=2773451 RepID=A0A927I1W5_9HYPH|nr:hypothetical protein [Bosea spartocytisi]MBD3846883.1 hypothetical protein [Bosea spartocytisi]MCT4474328.1 hypothetical protein [Bosea spartocytisi]